MMKNRKIVFGLCMLLCVCRLFANGGPVDGGMVYKVGDPHLLQVKNVELISEKLEITVEGDYTKIDVTYRLHNKSAQATGAICYGFPVEYCYMMCCDTLLTEEHFHSFVFRYNGKELPATASLNNPVAGYPEQPLGKLDIDDKPTYSEGHQRKWFYTHFALSGNETVTLEVSYVAKNNFEDYFASSSWFTVYGLRRLFYDFSPASYWGNGLVKEFQVIVHSPGNPPISKLPFRQNGDTYIYSQADFDLKTAMPLLISYDLTNVKKSAFILSNRIDNKRLKSIKASSTTAKYPLDNLFDGNLETAWVEGVAGPGINEWIEVKLDGAIFLDAIVIVNGYTQSKKTYDSNNRIKKLKLEIESGEVEFNRHTYEQYKLIELDDLPYQAIDLKQFASLTTTLFDGGDGGHQCLKFRITILDVYKGTMYDDTCLSELFVLGR